MKRSILSLAVIATLGLSAQPGMAAPHASDAQQSAMLKHVTTQVTTQLPRTVRPSLYDLSLTPDAKAASFSAKLKISISVVEATQKITLNAHELKFQKVSLLDAKGKLIADDAAVTLDEAKQIASFDFGKKLAKGEYQLEIAYTGVIGQQAVGLFSLDYDTPDGKKRALYTQFENSDARRVIPSWDEPIYKARFNLELTVPTEQLAVSNMPVISKQDVGNGKTQIKFATSPKMSTYLLFMSVGDFERATVDADGTEVGVIAKRGSLDQARYALEQSKPILREFNDYFGVRYPLPKLDNIAAPGQSQFFSAMENWGAIFTFENSILIDPDFSTQGHKEGVFVTAAHETAHQWFGNLVTMQWWDDLWLNEGFASWMENRVMRRLHPEWEPEFNAIGVRESAMGRDALATTHPVVQHIETVEQASQAFDTITYQKGEAVIRMLENYVGEDAWRNGVRAYMKKHAYGSTVTKDFFTQIEKAAGKPIISIARDFTQQPGVPLIRVDDVVCKDGKSIVSLSQGEFSKDHPEKKALQWQVPVVAQVAGTNVVGRTLVSKGKGSLQLPACGAVVLNAGQNGYYRTLYSPKAMAQLTANFAAVPAIDQTGILSDNWAMGMAGQQSIAAYLDLAKATPENASMHVWSQIAGVFAGVHDLLKSDPVRQQAFREFALKRLKPQMNTVGWEAKSGEAESVAGYRSSLIALLSSIGDEATLAEVRRRYRLMDSDTSVAPPELKMLILSIVANHADAATWDALRARAQAEKSAMVKTSLYTLLATAKDPVLAKRALELALTDEPGVTTGASMIAIVAGEHTDMAFDFAIANLDKVNARVDGTSRSRYFPGLAKSALNLGMIDKLNAYAEAHLDASARREVETAITTIKYRIKVRQERVPVISAWLDQQK
ncbi:MAG: M1 family metallopeptidase [Burkholderiales bacterium]|nr:M1 family metallopeptidase [Burkholderiales bacterium]